MRTMEGKRREPVEGEAETPSKMKIGLGQLERSTEINHNQSESFTVPVENHVTLSGVARMDNELVNSFSSETLSLKSELMNKPTEEKFQSKEDATCLRSMGKTEGDPLKYTLTRETESAMLEVKMQSCTQAYCDEILGKYQGLPEGIPEEAICAYLPQVQLHSYNINFPSSLMTQHRNSVLSVGTTPSEGAVNTNVDKIPVLRPLLAPNSSVNNCVSCGQIKGIINTSPESQPLSGSFGEPCNGIRTLPQDSASVCDESAEVREAVVSITTNSSEEAVFQNSDGETSHNLAVSQNAVEQPTCSHRNYSNPQVIICQLKGGTHILCINNTDTRELKAVHLVPQHQEQLKYFQPEANNSVTSVLGQFLPLEGKLNVCAQELDKGSMHTCHPDANLQEQTKMTLLGIPCSSWDAKSKKPCNCTKSQCLKLYCDCFANGDFCSNCNCNNCYNNPQHEIERFKAIKACLDRNPEAFLPKIGKGKLGDIKPRHNKGCNCKRSGCLKNYCECFEAKIMCSSICKCVGCKNYEESPDRKTLMNMPNHMESKSNEGNDSLSFSKFEILSKNRKDRQSSTCISWEVVEATCACLLAQAEEAEKEAYSVFLAERMILEEFGRCLSQILHSEFKSKGLKVD